jgi:hypothetical protein
VSTFLGLPAATFDQSAKYQPSNISVERLLNIFDGRKVAPVSDISVERLLHFEETQTSRTLAFFSSRAKLAALHVVFQTTRSTTCSVLAIRFCQEIEKRRSYEFSNTIKGAAYLLIKAKVRGTILRHHLQQVLFGSPPCGHPSGGANRLNIKPIEYRLP